MKVRATIFGGTGDLSYRKLMPAFYNLFVRGEITADSDILAIGRRDYTDESYHEIITPWIHEFARLDRKGEHLEEFLKTVHYLRMDFTDPGQYPLLEEYNAGRQEEGVPNLIYLAVAPQFFTVIAESVGAMASMKGARIILEKPFGDTLENACRLNKTLEASFGSGNIYRIDHYLGKEMVRNILAIRSTNLLFARAWDRSSIESVQISALEEVGVETRGGYYDQAGALKDMVQNHLLQILTIIAMENPASGNMHAQQLEVLHHLRPVNDISEEMVLGQYVGYRSENKVAPDSSTETFAAMKLHVDTDRWQGVPFLVRTGKKCGTRKIEAVLTFRRTETEGDPDMLVIEIQPTDGMFLEFNVKKPGDGPGLERVKLEYCQSCNRVFHLNTPEAYERMLWAAINSDQSWFSQWDQIETSWRFIQSVRDAYRNAGLPVYPYVQQSEGPAEAAQLTQGLARGWRVMKDPQD